MDPNYGKPEYFTRNVSETLGKPVEDFKIHPSRVIMMRGMQPARPDHRGADLGRQRAAGGARRRGGLHGRGAVDRHPGVRGQGRRDQDPRPQQNLATQEYANQLTARFAYANVAKSVVNTLLLDKEEEWQRVTANFTTLPDILQMYLVIVSGAADIPATRMLGQSPAGLNATGDADLRNYYDHVNSEQVAQLSPAMAVLDDVIIRSALGDRNPSMFYLWNPLWQLSEAEKATVAKSKADTLQIDVNTGLIDQEALRIGRQNQLIEDGTYPGLEAALEEQDMLDLESMISVEEQQAQQEAQQQAELQASQIGGMVGGPPKGPKKAKPPGAKDSPWERMSDERSEDFDPHQLRVSGGHGERSGEWTRTAEPAAGARARGLRGRRELSGGQGRLAAPRHADLTTPLQRSPTHR